LCIW